MLLLRGATTDRNWRYTRADIENPIISTHNGRHIIQKRLKTLIRSGKLHTYNGCRFDLKEIRLRNVETQNGLMWMPEHQIRKHWERLRPSVCYQSLREKNLVMFEPGNNYWWNASVLRFGNVRLSVVQPQQKTWGRRPQVQYVRKQS
jgi:hypothetical protein